MVLRSIAIASALSCLLPAYPLAAHAQQTSPMIQSTAGLSFKTVNRDRMTLRSSSQSGSTASGLATTSSGGIRVGGSASVVDVVLNALDESCDSCELPIAGDSSVFGNAFDIQSAPNKNSQFRLDASSGKSRGNLTSDFLAELLQFNEILRITELENPEEPLRPIKKVKTNENYTRLSSLASAQDSQGVDLNHGAHVISSQLDQSGRPRVNVSKLTPFKSASSRSVLAEEGTQRRVPLKFLGVGTPGSASQNLITSNNLHSSGGSLTHSKFSIVGFSTVIDPLAGRTATITSSMVTGKSFGSTSPVQAGTTLQDIADQYGTTVESLLLLNNLPNDQIDVTGLELEVPADLATIDLVAVEVGDTPTTVAARFGVSVDWLMELNGLTDPSFVFADITKLQIPGLRDKNLDPLPEALPTNAQLEVADYGAYTTFEETYQVEGAAAPLFQNALRRSF